jgi:hypothetical protein
LLDGISVKAVPLRNHGGLLTGLQVRDGSGAYVRTDPRFSHIDAS